VPGLVYVALIAIATGVLVLSFVVGRDAG